MARTDDSGFPRFGDVTIGGVRFTRDDRVLHGLAANRPDAAVAHAVIPHVYYNAVDTQAVSQTTGAAWVALV